MAQHVAQAGKVAQGRYAIERELGGGGTATVDLALDLTLHRYVPPKVLDRAVAAPLAPSVPVRDRRRAALSHPNIRVLSRAGTTDGRPC